MNFFELRGTVIIIERKINDINTIKSKMESQLIDLNARITKVDSGLTFSRSKLYSQLGILITKTESLGFMREGKVDFFKESHSLKISWTVKLDTLYFFSLCCSIVAGLIASISAELAFAVGFGIFFFWMVVFIGIVLIKAQLKDLINSSVYRNY